MVDATPPASVSDSDVDAPQRERVALPSPRFVIGVAVSLVLHVSLIMLLTMPGSRSDDAPEAAPSLLVEWMAVKPDAPQLPRTDAVERDATPGTPVDAATPAATADAPMPVMSEAPTEPEIDTLATTTDIAVSSPPAQVAQSGPVAKRSVEAAATPASDSGYVWDVLSHLQRFKDYPARARREGVEGTVLVQARISRGGAVLTASVARSSGHAALDRAASRLIERASPLPPPPLGALAITDLRLPVEYRLRDL